MTGIKTTANSGFALWGLTYFVKTFVHSSAFVLRMNSSAKNPPQRKARYRWQKYRKHLQAKRATQRRTVTTQDKK